MDAFADWRWQTDAGDRLVSISDAVAGFSGREPGWYTGKPIQALAAGGSAKALAAQIATDLAAREPIRGIILGQSARQCLICGSPQFDDQGEFTGYHGTAIALPDSSDEADAYLQSVINTAVDGVLVIDGQGIIQTVNAAAQSIFGYDPAELIGRNVKILMPEPYHSEHDGYLENYRTSGKARIIGIGREVVGRRKDGTDFPIDLSVGQGQLRGQRIFTVFVRDITHRKERERELRQTQEELQHITRSNLMGEMGSALAHEVNQPLTALTNYVRAAQRMLKQQEIETPEKVHDWMDQAVGQAARAAGVIQRLREFVRKGEVDKSFDDVSVIVEEALSLALVGARADGIDTEIDLAEGLPPVLCDRLQIQQVVLNLVRNAIEAMEEQQHRKLCVRTMQSADSAVRVEVTDTGSGLDETAAERLFEPFMTTKSEGMGIGLSVCHSIIMSYGGTISACENPVGGTIFSFDIPISFEDNANAE